MLPEINPATKPKIEARKIVKTSVPKILLFKGFSLRNLILGILN